MAANQVELDGKVKDLNVAADSLEAALLNLPSPASQEEEQVKAAGADLVAKARDLKSLASQPEDVPVSSPEGNASLPVEIKSEDAPSNEEQAAAVEEAGGHVAIADMPAPAPAEEPAPALEEEAPASEPVPADEPVVVAEPAPEPASEPAPSESEQERKDRLQQEEIDRIEAALDLDESGNKRS